MAQLNGKITFSDSKKHQKGGNMKVNMVTSLSADEKKKIDNFCHKHRLKMSHVVRESVNQYMGAYDPK